MPTLLTYLSRNDHAPARRSAGVRLRALAAALGVALLATLSALTGCGPGVGGTGTGANVGENALDDFGAMVAPVCDSAIASQLLCPGSTGAASQPMTTGTQRVEFVDLATGGRTRLVLQGNGADLQAECSHLHFSGQWGQAASGPARYYGWLQDTSTPAQAPRLATLEAALRSGSGLLLSLRLQDGSLVLGPGELALRAAAPGDPAPGPCPQ